MTNSNNKSIPIKGLITYYILSCLIFRIKGKTKWIWFAILSPLVMFLIAIVINFAITKNLPNLICFGIPEDLPKILQNYVQKQRF